MPQERDRLEGLWAGDFGDAYIARNPAIHELRRPFWHLLVERLAPRNVLEVGCSVGGNLRVIAEKVPAAGLAGIDVNAAALEQVRAHLPGIRAEHASAADLPFEDRSFDLVYSVGVLIHQPEESLEQVLREIHRCARKFILLIEYYSAESIEVPYRGESGALFKRDYGGLLLGQFPALQLVEHGFLSKDDGWDDDDFWLFEKPDDPG